MKSRILLNKIFIYFFCFPKNSSSFSNICFSGFSHIQIQTKNYTESQAWPLAGKSRVKPRGRREVGDGHLAAGFLSGVSHGKLCLFLLVFSVMPVHEIPMSATCYGWKIYIMFTSIVHIYISTSSPKKYKVKQLKTAIMWDQERSEPTFRLFSMLGQTEFPMQGPQGPIRKPQWGGSSVRQ